MPDKLHAARLKREALQIEHIAVRTDIANVRHKFYVSTAFLLGSPAPADYTDKIAQAAPCKLPLAKREELLDELRATFERHTGMCGA